MIILERKLTKIKKVIKIHEDTIQKLQTKTQTKTIKDQIKILKQQLATLRETQKRMVLKLKSSSQGFGRKGLTALRRKGIRAATGMGYDYAMRMKNAVANRGLNLPGYRNLTVLEDQIKTVERIKGNIGKVVKRNENLASKFAKRSIKERKMGRDGKAAIFRQKAGYAQGNAIQHEDQMFLLEEELNKMRAARDGVVPFNRRFRTDWE